MTPYYEDGAVTLYHSDCLDVLRTLPDCSVDAVVTDPPYGLEFMGKDWDRPWAVGTSKPGYGDAERLARPAFGDSRNANCRTCGGRQRGAKRCSCQTPAWDRHPREDMLAFGQWCEEWSRECLRVLKPGGHMLAFGGTRTWHRLVVAVEDAGFEIRDSIAWMYGSGFPKSLDVSKAIDKAAGAEREVVGSKLGQPGYHLSPHDGGEAFGHGLSSSTYETRLSSSRVTAPATDAARRWQGWGTALKPAFEPICVARKPLVGTVAANVQRHGTGALNIDGCRIGDGAESQGARPVHEASSAARYTERGAVTLSMTPGPRGGSPAGRWPANVVLDESQAEALDEQSGELTSGTLAAHHNRAPKDAGILGAYGSVDGERGFGDTGGASRFFYTAKASTDERITHDGIAHPTVKPLTLMRWLVRLVTPPGGLVLEPFAGSGTTVEAALLEGFRCIAIEREADYLPLITQRIHRRCDPVAYLTEGGHDLGLFGEAS